MTTPEGTAISKMLVLALQFSKGYLTTELVSRNATGKGDHEQSSTLRHERVKLPQNRREDDVHLNPLHQEGPNPYNQCALLRQTCQCTNRCVMQPQRTNVSDRLMKHSLERR